MKSTAIMVTASMIAMVLYWMFLSKGGRMPPGPIGLPFVGYLPFLTSEPHLDFQNLSKIYGPVFSVRLGSKYVIVLNDFSSIKYVFSYEDFVKKPSECSYDLRRHSVGPFAKTEDYVSILMYCCTSFEYFCTLDISHFLEFYRMSEISALPVEEWKFFLQILRQFDLSRTLLFEKYIRDELTGLLLLMQRMEGRPFLTKPLLSRSISKSIALTMFGGKLPYTDIASIETVSVLRETERLVSQKSWQSFFPWMKIIPQILDVEKGIELRKFQDRLQFFIFQEIEKNEKNSDANSIHGFIDFYLLEIQKSVNHSSCSKFKFDLFLEKFLQDVMKSIFSAGNEFVRITVDWLLLIMAAYPEMQRKIHLEIDEIIGRSHFPRIFDYSRMPFTNAVIMEVMRWRTISPLGIIPGIHDDLEVNGYFIPKDSWVVLNLWAVHHSHEYWSGDPDVFRPERFLTEDRKYVLKKDYFIPFSMGNKSCPGKNLATAETFLYFTAILQKFTLSLPLGKDADLNGRLHLGLEPIQQKLIFRQRG
ncbi:vitamin D 25-hydroxylase-like [Stegodyphus dumicola]|uniref:vitamin D 25-hydroxylase-like n=1 Tax=Stegodyphus dumicola TaxID=202533 RepID=UPI0015B0BEA8|nr:vitamin D 25-hydroxylase-like [Stegodyphus dumicola]